MREWTIDTWVLYRVSENDDTARELLAAILQYSHKVVFDNQGYIWRQYDTCLTSTQNRILKEWFKNINRSGAQVYYSGALPEQHEQALSDIRFHRDDFPFVAVAFHSQDKLLVAEGSDYTEQVCDYLQREMQVRVLSIEEALHEAQHRS